MEKNKIIFPIIVICVLVGAGLVLNVLISNGPSGSGGQTCMSCHTDNEKLLADLAANPLPEAVASEEAEGEG